MQESREFHTWRIDHRNNRTFQRNLQSRYDEELRAIGIGGTERHTVAESRYLHENVIRNLKRLEILADWWNTGRTDSVPMPSTS